MAQIIKDCTNIGIAAQQRHARKLQETEAMTLMLQLTSSAAKFHATREMAQRARPREIAVKIFRDVPRHPEKYYFDGHLRPVHSMRHPFPRVIKRFL